MYNYVMGQALDLKEYIQVEIRKESKNTYIHSRLEREVSNRDGPLALLQHVAGQHAFFDL